MRRRDAVKQWWRWYGCKLRRRHDPTFDMPNLGPDGFFYVRVCARCGEGPVPSTV
jgi:hypothetical protein